MKCFDSLVFQDRVREILEVPRHDDLGVALNGRSQDMPIIFIGQGQRWHERHVTRHQGISDVLIHQLASAIETPRIEIRALGLEVPNPFVMDFGRPPGPVQILDGQLQE